MRVFLATKHGSKKEILFHNFAGTGRGKFTTPGHRTSSATVPIQASDGIAFRSSVPAGVCAERVAQPIPYVCQVPFFMLCWCRGRDTRP